MAEIDPTDVPFVHLHTHTEYSLLDGAARVEDVVARAAELGQPAIAITDHGSLYGAVEFHQAARATGVAPIIGSEVYMARRGLQLKETKEDRDPWHLVLLARDAVGYSNLVSLSTTAQLEGFYQKPRIDRTLLADHAGGLIALSGCLGGELAQTILAEGVDAAERVAREHAEILGADNYFLEVQDHGLDDENVVNPALLQLARRTGLSLVATQDSHFVVEQDREAHDVMLCLQTGAKLADENRFRFPGENFHIASGAEMARRFRQFPDAIANTVALAERCSFNLDLSVQHLPRFGPLPNGVSAGDYLRELCEAGMRARYPSSPPPGAQARLATELEVIEGCGFSHYFLVVWDFINAARCDGTRVGPGRGSAAGSLVAYLLRITDIDPLAHGLLFERFLNKERISLPDIDVDFDDRQRDRAIRYVSQKYGADRVAQICAFGTMGAKAAIRDVGRVLDVPLPQIDRLAKLIPFGVNLRTAISASSDLRALLALDPDAKKVITLALELEGMTRTVSTHAAGVVIAPDSLVGKLPLQRPVGGGEGITTQFEMKALEKLGYVKFDFLGLKNLTIITDTLAHISATTGQSIDIDKVPLDDPVAFALLRAGDTIGIFQLEREMGRKILMDIAPRTLSDIAVASALNRPGPLQGGDVERYMRRRRGEEEITYLLPEMKPILEETLGVLVYQDQVMKIASAVAGYSLGEADILRAAMGKKKAAVMEEQRRAFVTGATGRGVEEATATELFELMAKFAQYGFNAAHAFSYGLISYQTAWLKANYPLQYMTALLTTRTAKDLEEIGPIVYDCQQRGLRVVPPDINRSEARFAVGDVERQEILYGLGHIRNVGDGAAQAIVAERELHGPYSDLLDICRRVPSRTVTKRAIEALVSSGACDGIGERNALLAQMDVVMKHAVKLQKEDIVGQASLFDGGPQDARQAAAALHPQGAPPPRAATVRRRLDWEREFLGACLSAHPLDEYEQLTKTRADTPVGRLDPALHGMTTTVFGAIQSVRTMTDRRGNKMAFLKIEDRSGTCDVVVFARTHAEFGDAIHQGGVVAIQGKVECPAPMLGGSAGVDLDVDDPAGDEVHFDPPKIIAAHIQSIDDLLKELPSPEAEIPDPFVPGLV